MDNWCSICLSDMDPETGLCTNPDCPNSVPGPILEMSIEADAAE